MNASKTLLHLPDHKPRIPHTPMKNPDKPAKDYYDVLGADESTSTRDLERLYKRMAALHHPDRGGSEEAMKSVNEAYSVLRDKARRRDYDAKRKLKRYVAYPPVYQAPARDVGAFGHFLSALMCLLVGLFLLFLVRFQWFWFLWPLAILAVFVIVMGVLMTRSALRTVRSSLPDRHMFRRYQLIQEALFWTLVFTGVYGVYILFQAVE